MKFSKGFTLIELLVVIAIIGILSSVVLASLNTARAKGADAAIKSQLAAIRPQAEIFYDTIGSYGSSTVVTIQTGSTGSGCTAITASMFVDPTINNQVKGVAGNSATVNCMIGPTTTNTAWAISAALKTAGYWCVDSTGASKNTGPITTAVCP